MTDCQIVEEDYRKILRCVRDYFEELQEQGLDVSFYHRLRHTGYLRHLVVRRASKTGEILAALVTTSQVPGRRETGGIEKEILEGLQERLRALPLDGEIVGILHVRNDSAADVVQSDKTTVLYGRDYFYEELLGLRFKISLFSFFQTNSLGAELLYSTAREYISDYVLTSKKTADEAAEQMTSEALKGMSDETAEETTSGDARETTSGCTGRKIVYDLYSGTGTIAQLMAPVAKKVIGVEIVEEAVGAAWKNAELNDLHNCEFIAGDVLKVLDGIAEKPDVIILDPPRDGVHPKALTKIIDYGVEHILYISCKASSLARDLEIFLARGYRAERCVAIDQFPWTAGVESIVLLSKLHAKQNIEVELEMSELDLTAAESKATYAEIKQYVLDKYGLKVSSLNIAQIKAKCGIIERENYNTAKNENVKQPNCTEEKENAIKNAFKYFQMI